MHILASSITLFCVLSLAYAPGAGPGGPRTVVKKVKTKGWRGQCQFSGYKPGGGDIVISPITAPTAKLQENQLDNIITIGKEGSGLGEKAVESVTTFTKNFQKIGPKLAQSFGIIGALAGGYETLTAPGPDDVLEAVNKALSELTAEVNNRFAALEYLIQENLRNLRNELRIAEFQTDSSYWKSCIKAGGIEEANACQVEAYRLSSSKKSKYAALYNDWDKGNGVIFDDEDKFRKAEVNLLTFRNYCQLNIMMLLTLIQTFDGQNEERTTHYRGEIYTWIEFCHGYLSWSVEQVLKAYTEFEYKVICVHDEDITNFLGFVFSKEYTCSARLGYNYPKNVDCTISVSENRLVQLPPGYTDCCGGGIIAQKKLKTKFEASFPAEKKSITNYMSSHFTGILAKWKEVQSSEGEEDEEEEETKQIPNFAATNVATDKRKVIMKLQKNTKSRPNLLNLKNLKESNNKRFVVQADDGQHEDEMNFDDGTTEEKFIQAVQS